MKTISVSDLASYYAAFLELPLPPKGCSPNVSSHTHWSVRHRAVKEFKEWVKVAALSAIKAPIPKGQVLLSSTWYLCRKPGDDTSYYPKDIDNAMAAMKAVADALVEAGYLKTDSHEALYWQAPELLTRKKDHKGRTGITVMLTVR